MAGIAGIVDWTGQLVPKTSIARMLEVVRHRGPDGLNFDVRGSVALGHARFALSRSERERTQPVWLLDGSCGMTADVRLTNRMAVLAALGSVNWLDASPTDAEIVLAAYERWGSDCVGRLRGDYAFVAWDKRRQRVFAARDPFGVKPLFYLADERHFCFGSEPKQLLALPGVEAISNEGPIADLLINAWGSATEETFFRNIMRLRPGHSLDAGPAGVRVASFWNPGPIASNASVDSPEGTAERFYELFRAAVANRLLSDSPIAIELSGGYDSSSVVLTAADVQSLNSRQSKEIFTLSHCYPDLPCDESMFIDAVLECCPFRSIKFDAPIGDFTTGLSDELWKADAPIPDIAWCRRAMGAARLAAEGCRVALTGLGGDELVWDPDYEIDLWRERHFVTAIRYCLSDPRVLRDGSQRECLSRLARFAAPAWLKVLWRRVSRRPSVTAPPWATSDAIRIRQRARPTSAPETRFPSAAQTSLHSWLTSPGFYWLLESEERLAAYHGIELRHPFLDQNLVEFVLAIPWRTRYALRGPFKTLLLGAMADRLPTVVRVRHGKTVFDEYLSRLYNASRKSIQRELFVGDHWGSGRFIDRQTFEADLARIRMTEAGGWTDLQSIWIAAAIEFWLCGLSGIVDRRQGLEGQFPSFDPTTADFAHFRQSTDSARVRIGEV